MSFQPSKARVEKMTDCQMSIRGVKSSSTLITILAAVTVIVLVCLVICQYAVKEKASTTDAEDKKSVNKKHIITALGVGGAVFSALAAAGSLYALSQGSKAMSVCN